MLNQNVLVNINDLFIEISLKVPLNEIKFYYMEGDGSGITNKINSDMYDALHRAINYIENKQIKVKKVSGMNLYINS